MSTGNNLKSHYSQKDQVDYPWQHLKRFEPPGFLTGVLSHFQPGVYMRCTAFALPG